MNRKAVQRRAPGHVPNLDTVFFRLDGAVALRKRVVIGCYVQPLRVITKPVPLIAVHHHIVAQQEDPLRAEMVGQPDGCVA